MLPLERCREILGEDAPADDRQLEKARDHAYRLARLLLEIYREEKAKRLEAELAEDPEI